MRWLPTRGGRWPSHLDRATREALGIPSRERVLGWGIGRGIEGERVPVVATDQALYGGPLAPRVRWDEIGRATWEEPLLSLTGTVDGDPCSGSIELVEPGLLTAAIRTQVTDSVVIAERLDLGPGPGAQAIARRASQDGEIRWTIAFDPGADPADRDLRARADRALAELRATLGI
jgi:hypothetical protein